MLDVTSTVTVQLLPAGMVSPLKVRLVAALTNVFEPAPVHVPPAVWSPLIDMPDSVSVNVAEVRSVAVLFARVNVMVEVSPVVIVAG